MIGTHQDHEQMTTGKNTKRQEVELTNWLLKGMLLGIYLTSISITLILPTVLYLFTQQAVVAALSLGIWWVAANLVGFYWMSQKDGM